MSSKEIKKLLKTARESLDSKNYDAVIESCREILALDSANYYALVFLGKAHEGRDEPQLSLEAYKRATELTPDQLLAWQGLMSYYEKNKCAGNRAYLANVYEKLISVGKDNDEKIVTIEMKLADIYCELYEQEKALKLFEKLLDKTETSVNDRRTHIYKSIIKLHTPKSPVADKVLKPALEYFLFNNLVSDSVNTDELCKTYLELFDNDTETTASACQKLQLSNVISKVPYELNLLMNIDNAIFSDVPLPDTCLSLAEKLREIHSESPVLIALKVYQLCDEGKFSEAHELVSKLPSNEAVFQSLKVKCAQGLHRSSEVIEFSDKLMSGLNRFRIYSDRQLCVKKILLMKVYALLYQNNGDSIGKAGQLCKQLKMDHDSPEVNIALCYVCLVLGNLAAAKKICEKLHESAAELAVKGWYHYHNNELNTAKDLVERAVENDPGTAVYQYHLARIYWRLLENDALKPQQCMTALMKAAKLDPYHSDTFFWLGRYFEKFSSDTEKARRCYQKAYDLNGYNDIAAEYLVECLNRLGLEEETVGILRSVTEQASPGKWAWLRLGLYLVKPEPSQAIHCFQNAVRSDPKDSYSWQCLADGYLNRGSYNSAMKTFTKANELNPSCIYNLYQLANIKQLLGLFLEAVEDYQAILNESEDYVPALKGLAETHIKMARESMDKFYSLKTVDNCRLALKYLSNAASKRPDLTMLWKLIGDACTLLGDGPNSITMSVPGKLCGETCDEELDLTGILELGCRAYSKALQINPEDDVIWYDLSVNYIHQAERKDCLDDAVKCLKKALSLNPGESKCWSTLGVVLAKRNENAEAQHCFIKAVEIDSHDIQAWANLGVLYLSNSNITLAHEAFKVAQSLDPDYVNGWIGQALVAETVAHAETVDLFRHCNEISLHQESAIGYTHWILDSLIQGTSIPDDVLLTATDSLTRYVDRNDEDYIAINMYGLLLERQGLYPASETALKTARDLSRDEHRNLITSNYARVLCKNGKFDEAINEYRSLNDVIPLGCVFYKAGNYEKAKKEYGKAEINPEIRTMLGLCEIAVGDFAQAKTQLFDCVKDSEPPIQALLSLCALGLLTHDLTLAHAVIQELQKFDGKFIPKISKLSVIYYVISGQKEEATTYLNQMIEKYPESTDLLLLKIEIAENHENIESFKPSPSQLYTAAKLSIEAGHVDSAYRYACNSFFCFPDEIMNLRILSSALFIKILNCTDFKKCLRNLNGLRRILKKIDHQQLTVILQFTDEFLETLNDIPDNVAEELNFIVEMRKNRYESEENDEMAEPGPVINGEALLLRGFMEVLTIGQKLDNWQSLKSLLDTYSSSGVYQFDKDLYSRDHTVYSRKMTVKKTSNVKFPTTGLLCKARCLAYELASIKYV